MRLLIVDDQPTVRRGMRMRLQLEPDITVVGEAGDGARAVELARALKPDVVLMDIRMPVMDGIQATRELQRVTPQTAVVLISLYDDGCTRCRAEEAGAAAFISKHEVDRALLPALRQAAAQSHGRHPGNGSCAACEDGE